MSGLRTGSMEQVPAGVVVVVVVVVLVVLVVVVCSVWRAWPKVGHMLGVCPLSLALLVLNGH